MNTISYFKFALCSCIFWGALAAIGYYNTDPGNWKNGACWVILVFSFVAATEVSILLAIFLIRKKMGYEIPKIG